MISQFNNLSSWREDNIVIEPHETYTLTFLDTSPNMFVIINPNVAMLKVSISSIPTTERFETKVEYNSTETFGRPTGTRYLYILNDSSKKVSVKVFSIHADFDISILKNLTVSINDLKLEANTIIDGFSSGVSLPSGNNTIGKIGLSSNEYNLINSIKTIVNSIYGNTGTIDTNVSNVKDNIVSIINLLSAISTTITNVKPITVVGNSTTTIESKDTTGNTKITGINFIRCKTGSLTFSMNNGTEISLSSGDAVSDINGIIDIINVNVSADISTEFEIVYYEKI